MQKFSKFHVYNRSAIIHSIQCVASNMVVLLIAFENYRFPFKGLPPLHFIFRSLCCISNKLFAPHCILFLSFPYKPLNKKAKHIVHRFLQCTGSDVTLRYKVGPGIQGSIFLLDRFRDHWNVFAISEYRIAPAHLWLMYAFLRARNECTCKSWRQVLRSINFKRMVNFIVERVSSVLVSKTGAPLSWTVIRFQSHQPRSSYKHVGGYYERTTIIKHFQH